MRFEKKNMPKESSVCWWVYKTSIYFINKSKNFPNVDTILTHYKITGIAVLANLGTPAKLRMKKRPAAHPQGHFIFFRNYTNDAVACLNIEEEARNMRER